MSQIDFPSNPSNGDTLTAGNITWTFNSTVGVWQNNVIGLSGASISIAADAGTTDSVTLGVDTLTISGSTGLTSTVSNNQVSVALDNTAVSAGTYGTSSSIPQFTVDSQGRITSATTVSSVPTAEMGIESVILNASNITNGTAYGIKTLGNTNFASLGAQSVNISATSNPQLVETREYIITSLGTAAAATTTSNTKVYKIVSVGNTDFTAIGASANTVGVGFTATGAGSGDGTVVEITNWIILGAGSESTPPSVGDRFRARGTGNASYGTGTVLETLFTANGTGSGTGTVALDTTHFITFVDSTTGTSKILSEPGLQYNPGKGTIFASNLDGQFTGRFEGTFKGSFDSTTTIGQSDAALTVTVTQHDTASVPSGDNLFFVGIEDAVSGTGRTLKADTRIYYDDTNDKLVTNALDVSGNVTVGGNLDVTGDLTLSGDLTFGDNITDKLTFTGAIDSNFIPDDDGIFDLGSSSKEWKDIYIDGVAYIDTLVADTVDINEGTIDGTTIATSDITVGSGKTLDVSAGTLTLADNQISGDKINSGTIDTITITTLASTTVDTETIEVSSLKARDGTAAGSIADSTGKITLNDAILTTADINGGAIDAAAIGANSHSTGKFTPLEATTSITGDLTGDVTGGLTLGGSDTLDVSAGTLTLADNQLSGDKVHGGALSSVTIDAESNTISNLDVGDLKSGVLDTDLSSASSNDDTLASAKAVKTYVDSNITTQNLSFVGDDGTGRSVVLNSESLTIAGGTGLTTAGSGQTLTVNIDNTVATLTGSQTFTNKTLTSPVLDAGVSGTAIDTDLSSVSSNDDTLASAKAIKTYADSKDITVSAVTNETTVNRTGNAITVGLPNDVTVAGTLTVSGSGTTTAISIPNADDVILGSIQSVSGLNYDAPVGGDLTIHEGNIILKGDSSAESGITWNRFNSSLSVTNSSYSIYGTSTLRYYSGRFDFTTTTGADNQVAEVRAHNFRATNGFSRASDSAGPLLTTGNSGAWTTGSSSSHGTTILYADSTSRIKADITVDTPAASGNTFALETSSSYPYADVSGVTDLSKKAAILTTAADANTDAEFPLVFINNTGGNTYSSVNYHDLEKDAGILKYNPSTGALSATSFVGNIQGSSSVAEKIVVVNEESASASHFITFADGVSSSRDIHADSGLTYVPSTGTLTVDNLTVAGTTTTLNTATLDVADTNITIAKNATTLAGINGAGLTFGNFSSNPVFSWDNGNSRFKFNKNTHIEGTLTATTFSGFFTGDILAANGTTVIDVGSGSNATFSGTSSKVTVNNYNNSTAYNLVLHNGSDTLLQSQLYSPTITTNTGLLTIPGATTFNGNITLGSNARLASNIVPSTNDTRSLGSTSARFFNVHAATFTGNLDGNIKDLDGTTVLYQGGDGTAATFTGNVTGNTAGTHTGAVSFSGASSFASSSTLDFANVTISNLTPDDLDDSSSTKQFYTDEKVDDRLNALISTSNSGLSKTYDDTANSLTLAIDLNGLTAADIDSSQDSIAFIDATNNGSRKESIADFATNFVNGANSALTASSGKLSLNLDGLASEVLSVPNDSIVFIDADGSASKKESVTDFVGAIAGTNITQDSTNKTLGILNETIEDIVGAMFTDSFVSYNDNAGSSGTITISQNTSSGVNLTGSADNTNHYIILSDGQEGASTLRTDAILRFDTTDDTLNVPNLKITNDLKLDGATISSNVVPSANNQHDLGSTSSKWKDIHIAGNVNFGNLNDGTNSVGSFVTSIGNASNTTVPTEGAVKSYVDNATSGAVTGITGGSAITASGSGTITIDLDLGELGAMSAAAVDSDKLVVLDTRARLAPADLATSAPLVAAD